MIKRKNIDKAKVSDEEFVEIFQKYGAHETSRRIGVTLRNVYKRRVTLEKIFGRQMEVMKYCKP